MCPVPEPRDGELAEGTQAALQVQGVHMPQMQPHRRETAGDGGTGGPQETAGHGGCHRSGAPGLYRGDHACHDARAVMGTGYCQRGRQAATTEGRRQQ